MNILIVDDNPDTADTVAALFGLRGHATAVAHDPLSALASTRDFQPDVAVIDIGLPGMDGYELAEHLRVNGATCPIVIMTGSPQRDVRRCARLGIECYLVKPVDFDVLIDAVELGAHRDGIAA
jgi:two-component system CheB/CheR fusion protein